MTESKLVVVGAGAGGRQLAIKGHEEIFVFYINYTSIKVIKSALN